MSLFKTTDMRTEFSCVDRKTTVGLDGRSGLEDMEDKIFRRYADTHYAVVDHLEQIGMPQPGEQLRFITRRVFNAVQFIELITRAEVIEHMRIAIYSINFNAAKILMSLVNSNKIKQLDIMMSNLRNKAHREKETIVKDAFVNHDRISIFFCKTHAKVMVCRTDAGNYYTMEGSGNMAWNSRIEQYVIDNDKGMYDFTCEWMEDIKTFLAGTKELQYE